jgi:hypothetical protein
MTSQIRGRAHRIFRDTLYVYQYATARRRPPADRQITRALWTSGASVEKFLNLPQPAGDCR